MARPKLAGVHSFELVAVVFAAGVLLFLRIRGLTIDPESVTYTLKAMVASLPGVLVVGLVGRAAFEWWGGSRGALRDFFRPARLLLWIRLWLGCWVVSFGYFWLKVCVPLLQSRRFDVTLWDLDEALHLGVAPSAAVAHWLAETPVAGPLDLWYAGWLATLLAGIGFFSTSRDDALRRAFVLSCVLLWVSGAIVYLLVPAQGPAFAFSAHWVDLQTMPRAAAAQALLESNYDKLLAIRAGRPTSAFSHTLGLAAFPSLHVGFHFLFALWIRHEVSWLFVPVLVVAGVTFVGSLATGWHYAVDGYVGALVAWACYRLAIRLESVPRIRKDPSTE